jgi:hypothetical protein
MSPMFVPNATMINLRRDRVQLTEPVWIPPASKIRPPNLAQCLYSNRARRRYAAGGKPTSSLNTVVK